MSTTTSKRRNVKRPIASSYRPSKERIAALSTTLEQFPDGVPRPEYPRPRLVRGGESDWLSLNGVWEFSFDIYDQGLYERLQDKKLPDFCLVPFAPQWELSCKNERDVYEVAWYARDFEIPASWLERDRDVLLHFGACDYKTTVWVNDNELGHNQGGHVPFSLDLTAHLQPGTNRVVLRVEDKQDPRQPRGKQAVSGLPKACDYWCTTGIWQSVWLESTPSVRIQDVLVIPQCGSDPANDALEITVYLHAPASAWRVEVEVFEGLPDEANGNAVVTRANVEANGAVARVCIPLPHARRWSPDTPHLYGLRVRLFEVNEDTTIDEVLSYAGLRAVGVRKGFFQLNGEPLYLQMVLDQGYWPRSGMTAPSDEALRTDIEWCKKFGFNGARKHQKVEDPRWLYWCDRLGLLVWGEMANARAWSPEAEEMFLAEWERAVRRDVSHPCIVAWVPLNESWGVPGLQSDHPSQHAFVERVVALTRRLDASRPIVDNDGWEHSDITDIVALHDYRIGKSLERHWADVASDLTQLDTMRTGDTKGRRIFVKGARYRGQPVMLTEIGGFLNIPDLPREKWDWLYQAYQTASTPDELLQKYCDLMQIVGQLPWVTGFCYTQLTDVEQEINGLLTYDRQAKIEPEHIAQVHRAMRDADYLA